MTIGCNNGYLTDPKAYFFSLIGRMEGSPAPDWKAVLESLPLVYGMGTNPRPGEVQPPDAKCYGITVMIDAGGNARGRIWLPTAVPVMADGNAWYTHEFQVIADGPDGGMVWAWQDKGGAPYSPHACDSGEPGPGPEPPPSGDHEARIAALEAAVAKQQEQINMLADVMPDDEKIARIAMAAARAALEKATLDVRVGSNWGHGHAGSGTIRP